MNWNDLSFSSLFLAAGSDLKFAQKLLLKIVYFLAVLPYFCGVIYQISEKYIPEIYQILNFPPFFSLAVLSFLIAFFTFYGIFIAFLLPTVYQK